MSQSNEPPLLHVERIEKRFETVKAVDGLGFEVKRGEVFALLGPNGAGKTTTVRMLLGINRPDAGSIRYSLPGAEGASAPPPHLVGYLPEERGLFKDTTILRTIAFLAGLRGVTREDARTRALEWLERLGLKGRGDEKVEALSKGNQQKVQFIASIIHRPAFAILDEPFSGLDPVNQEYFLGLLRELRDAGTTILLSAHQMQLVERVADRILVMSRGRAVLHGTLAELRREAGAGSRLTLKVAGAVDLGALRAHPSVLAAEAGPDGVVTVQAREGAELGPILAAAANVGAIEAVRTEEPTLHDIYVRAVGDDALKSEPTPAAEESA
ncbi:MAG: ATP-binding cassette domain-containing protein [Candidatus Sumerlaeia bacterium]|nr:ATP-binding cassette domain-containing protein [Candidatus Sumerlaeia bacterium]